MKKGYKLLSIVVLLFCYVQLRGQNTEDEMLSKIQSITKTFLTKNVSDTTYSILRVEKKELKNHKTYFLVHLSPKGFLMLSPESSKPVWAYSLENNFSMQPDKQIFTDAILLDISKQKPAKPQLKKAYTEISTGPFIHTLWGQVNCYDNHNNIINVTNYYTPSNYAAGCVAISMSLVLHFYKWPIHGIGSFTYSDNQGSSTGTYSANFINTYYAWNQMLERYRYRSSTLEQRQAAGELVYQVAVALRTDFEFNGSTSNVNRIPAAGKNYFRFNGLEHKPSSSTFWKLLYTNLVNGIPVVLAVKADNGAGHSIVCDGLKIDKTGDHYYHLNMEWWGDSNGWYRIRDTWNAGGYTSITDGIFYLLPIPEAIAPHYEDGADKITFSWNYPSKVNTEAFEVQEKIGTGKWTSITTTVQDTFLIVDRHPNTEQYFRVRAKVAGRWPDYSWSNEVRAYMDNTGIPDYATSGRIKVSPNPVVNHLDIDLGSFPAISLQVFDIVGHKMIQKYLLPGESNFGLDVQFLTKGVYIVRLMDNQNKIKTVKFIKK